MRTKLNSDQIKEHVESILGRLGLTDCQDTQIGGMLKRGISGGERRRTSIAYELITNPSLLLLDEPTSGLDSSSAMRVVKSLREEAKRGMSVLATIHSPSAELLFMFDRIILMSEGHMIYNGPPKQAG